MFEHGNNGDSPYGGGSLSSNERFTKLDLDHQLESNGTKYAVTCPHPRARDLHTDVAYQWFFAAHDSRKRKIRGRTIIQYEKKDLVGTRFSETQMDSAITIRLSR